MLKKDVTKKMLVEIAAVQDIEPADFRKHNVPTNKIKRRI